LDQFLIGNDLQQRIIAQTIGIVGVFVASHDLIESRDAAAAGQ